MKRVVPDYIKIPMCFSTHTRNQIYFDVQTVIAFILKSYSIVIVILHFFLHKKNFPLTSNHSIYESTIRINISSRIYSVLEKMEQKFHSSLFHPTLRKWQESNVSILPENLMYPLFLM